MFTCSGLNWSPDWDQEVIFLKVILAGVREGMVFLSNINCLKWDVSFYLVKYLLLQTAKMWLVRKSHEFNTFYCPLTHWWFSAFYSPELQGGVTVM